MIDFPANPTVGQTIQVGGCIYTCVSINPAVWSARISTSGIPDAPVDDRTYGRRNGAWEILTKATIGLSQVDNTSDANKPVSTAQAAADALKYDKTGGTLTGNVQVNIPANQNAQITLNHVTEGNASDFYGSYNNVAQWLLRLGAGGAANDFQLHRMNNAGAIIGTPIQIRRDNGQVVIMNSASEKMGLWLTDNGGASSQGAVLGLHNSQWGTRYIRTYIDGAITFINAAWSTETHRFGNDGTLSTVSTATIGGTLNVNGKSGNDSIVSAGTIVSNAAGGTHGFYSAAGHVTTGGQGNFAGRLTGSVGGDVAAIYCAAGSSGIYTEGNGSASFRSTQGGITITGNGSHGVNFSTYAPEGGYSNTYGLLGNPNWNQVQFQLSHQHGVWAGARILGGSNEIQFVTSNGGGWGSVKAASFEVQSDERIKRDVALLPAQRAALMAIKPISWKSPIVPFIEQQVPVIENIDGTFVQFPPASPIYDDPERVHWGFSAQNLSAAVGVSVRGSTDAVDEDGKIVPAGVNPIPIIALTVLEVQELINEVADLRARVVALEAP